MLHAFHLKLSDQDKKFCRLVVEGWSLCAAAREIGKKYKNDRSATVSAHKFAQRPAIAAYIDKLKQDKEMLKQSTRGALLEKMQKIHDIAMEKGDLANALKAIDQIAKINDLYKSNMKLGGKRPGSAAEIGDEGDLDRALEERSLEELAVILKIKEAK